MKPNLHRLHHGTLIPFGRTPRSVDIVLHAIAITSVSAPPRIAPPSLRRKRRCCTMPARTSRPLPASPVATSDGGTERSPGCRSHQRLAASAVAMYAQVIPLSIGVAFSPQSKLSRPYAGASAMPLRTPCGILGFPDSFGFRRWCRPSRPHSQDYLVSGAIADQAQGSPFNSLAASPLAQASMMASPFAGVARRESRSPRSV